MPILRTCSVGAISLYRHGESEANSLLDTWYKTGNHKLFTSKVLSTNDSAWVLTSHGTGQAQSLGAWLAKWFPPVNYQYSSPYLRAVQTSTIVHGGTKPLLVPELEEQNWGDLNTKTPEELGDARAVYDAASKLSADARPPGGESFREVYERVAPFAALLINSFAADPSQHIAVSSHYAVRRTLMFHLRGWPLERISEARGIAWKSNNCQIAVFTGDHSGKLNRMINPSPAVLEDISSIVWF